MKPFFRSTLLLVLVIAGLTTTAAFTAGAAVQGSMIDRYRESLRVDPDNPTLHYFLGIALIREDLTKEGLKELRIAYPAYTDSIEMQYNMGLAFSKLGDADSAMLYLEQAEVLGALASPEEFPLVNAFYNVGLLYLEDDNLKEAEKIFAKVLRLDPKRFEVYRLLGDIAARSNRHADAVKYLSGYLEHYPDDQAARDYLYALYFNQALMQLGKEDNAGARQSFLKAYELTPDSPLVLYYLGSIDYSAGNIDSAIEKLRLAYPNAPDELANSTRAMLYNCALKLTQEQQWDKGLLAMEPLIDNPQARTKDLLLAGNIYLQLKDFSKARELYLRVLSLEPANSKAVVNLSIAENGAVDSLFEEGRILFQRGEYSQALEKFNDVLAIRSDEHRSLSYKRKVLERVASDATGAFTEAKLALQRQDFLGAVTHANRGLDMQPENAEGKRLRQEAIGALQREITQLLDNGNALLERNDFPAAAAQFTKVTRLDPANVRALQGISLVEQKMRQNALASVAAGNKALDNGKLKEAQTSFKQALTLAPELKEAKEGLARLESLVNSMIAQEVQWGRQARSAGRLDQARTHFNNALNLRDSAEVRRELAAIDKARDSKLDSLLAAARKSRAGKDFANARKLYQQILDVDPQHPARAELSVLESEVSASIATALNRARKELQNGHYQKALSSYRKALDLDPANKEALAGLEKGRNELASTISNLVTSGNTALNQGKFDAAESDFQRVLALDPYNATATEALQRLDKIRMAGANSGDADKLYLRGIEFYTRGKYAEAVSAWEQVLLLSPGHEKARMNIEKARRKLEKIKEYQGG